jgi:hypothetical protein
VGDESRVLLVVREIREACTRLTDSMALRLYGRGGATAPEEKATDQEDEHRAKDSTQQAGRIIGVVPASFLPEVSGCKRAGDAKSHGPRRCVAASFSYHVPSSVVNGHAEAAGGGYGLPR